MLTNWARNVEFHPARTATPRSLDELQEVVAESARVRALGTGHSFSTVADTEGTLVVLDAMPRRIDVDAASLTATVSGAARWAEVAAAVRAEGVALANMGSLPHISVAGSASTGTHGSGERLGALATSVRALTLVLSDGRVRRVARGDDEFDGAVVALGSLGVVHELELDLVPHYDIEQTVWEGLPLAIATEHLDTVMGCARSVSLFTTWAGDTIEQVWVKRDTADAPVDLGWAGALRADGPRHPVPGMDVQACTQQLSVSGPWDQRVPHFRMEFTPSSGDELQTEYMVAREHGPAALEALRAIGPLIAPVLQISEVRVVAADPLWLSPFHQRDSLCLHFTWVADSAAVAPVVAAVERALEPFAPRPHWGKVFGMEPEAVRAQYPRWREFTDLRDRLDPRGAFANAFTDRYLPR